MKGPRRRRLVLGARAVTAILAAAILGATLGCDPERRHECERLLAAMKPLETGTPSSASVAAVQRDVGAIAPKDEPLHEYARSYADALTVLYGVLVVKEAPDPPDGTDDVIQSRLKEARVVYRDTARYCTP